MTEDGTSYIEADGFRVYEQGPRPEPEEGKLLQARVRPLKNDGHSFTVSWGFIDAPVGDDWDSWIVRQTPVVTDETYWERYREDPETEVIVLPDSVVAKLFGLPDSEAHG